MIRSAALLTLALAPPAGAFELALPVDCTLGDGCYIQQFPDHDPGPGAADFTCGPLSYDGHDGTDFALPTRADMDRGVTVLAAAPGAVKGTRDGVQDFAPPVEGRECGNGVVIDHGNGWETQYCHLKQGTVRVATGDRVDTGTPLGQIGQSGQAAFPHLHLSVRQDGREVDPFAPAATACGSAGDDLWAPDIAPDPGGLLGIGIAPSVPDFAAIKAGLLSPDLPVDAPALVVWAYLFGPRAGDALILSITGPEGEVISERVVLDKTQALAFRAVGRKLRAAEWPPGPYAATATLLRGAQELDRMAVTISLHP
jgi:murein DD-endopeptidase MepM/ murein hydrolase activator NlpD